VSKVGILK